jgi:hypothetical protein
MTNKYGDEIKNLKRDKFQVTSRIERMSILIPKGKHWQKLSGSIKIHIDNTVFLEESEEWIPMSTYVPFPLDEDQTLEAVFISFVEFDMNSKAVYTRIVREVKDVHLEA